MQKTRWLPLLSAAVLLLAFGGCSRKDAVYGGDWTILSGAGCTQDAKRLQDSINGTGVAHAEVVTEYPDDYNGRLILVGDADADLSREAVLKLREQEFLVEFGRDAVIIAGGSDEKTAEAVDYVCENYLAYLEEYHDLPFGTEYDYFSFSKEGGYVTKQFLLNGVSVDRYQITALGGEENEAAGFLQNAIKNMTGAELAVSEECEEDAYCIQIVSGSHGPANSLKDQQFRILQEDGMLYLCAGNEEQELLAVKMFCMKYMDYDYINAKSNASMLDIRDVDFTFTCDWDAFTAPKAMQARILSIPPEDGYSVLQGGCTDGTYAYYILNNQDFYPYVNRIYKVDLAAMEIVKVSDKLELQHANSITYNSRTGQLISVNYDPDKTTLTYVDPDTLTVTGTTTVDFNALSLAYDAEHDTYVAGTRGTFDFFLLDADFEITDYCDSIQTKSVKQEVEVYGDKILFSMSGENIIYVYDLEGKFLYSVNMGMPEELENLIFYGDYAYAGYFSSGGVIYETIFYQELE